MTRTLRIPRTPPAVRTQRPDLIVHALAQLPDDVEVSVKASAQERPHLEQIARAYGIERRIAFTDSSGSSVLSYRTFGELVNELSLSDRPAPATRFGPSLSGQRIAIITNLPAPYRNPLFKRMQERLEAEGAALRVLFLTGLSTRPWMNADRGFGFEHETLRSVSLPIRTRRPHLPLDLEHHLKVFGPTIVLAAGLSPFVAGRAARFARQRGISFGLWSGEIPGTDSALSITRRRQRKRLVAGADFAIAYGCLAGEYLRSIRPELPYVYSRNTSVRDTHAHNKTGGGSVKFLVVGDLASRRKGIDVVLDALRLVPSLDCRLTVVGGGALQEALARYAASDARIRFAGPLAPAEVRQSYAEADAFLFPTRADIFGLVLVEAMSASLAVVTASTPGAVCDLAVRGHNCIVLDTHEPRQWAEALVRVVQEPELRAGLGEAAARTIARRWTMAHSADAMVAGLRLGMDVQKDRRR